MKEKWRTLKEWRKNPRHNAIFKLLCWFIFFGIIYIILVTDIMEPSYEYTSSSNKNSKFTKDTVENYINMDNYEYEYTISYDDNTVNIKGIVYDDKDYFEIGDNTYYDDGTLYLVDEEAKTLTAHPQIDLPILLSEINRSSIYLWLSEGEVTETLEYKDGTTNVIYVYSPTDEYKIEISTQEKDYLINTIKIDLLDLLSTKGLQYNNFDIDINYTNINNISSYEKNYDTYEIIDNTIENNDEPIENNDEPIENNDETLEEDVA